MKFLACLLVLCLCGPALPQNRFSLSFGKDYGLALGTEYLNAGGRERSVELDGFTLGGFSAGFVRPFHPRWIAKIQLFMGDGLEKGELWKDAGLVDESRNVEFHDVRFNYQHSFIGMEAVLLYAIPLKPRFSPYFFAGAGVAGYNFVLKAEIEDQTASDGTPISFGGDNSQEKTCFLGTGGTGAALKINRSFSLFIQYKARYWRPVEYRETFLPGVTIEYLDVRWCHLFEIGILLNL